MARHATFKVLVKPTMKLSLARFGPCALRSFIDAAAWHGPLEHLATQELHCHVLLEVTARATKLQRGSRDI